MLLRPLRMFAALNFPKSVNSKPIKPITRFAPTNPRYLHTEITTKHTTKQIDKMFKLAVLGSGSWGTTAARILAANLKKQTDPHCQKFDPSVSMWIYDELVNGRKLSEIINNDHENVKYLPGVQLPDNLIAVPDAVETVRGATHLVFVIPHQFVEKTVQTIKPHLAKDVVGISLIKGVFETASDLKLVSAMITESLGINMSVLSGANIALEIAKEMFSETTIACSDAALGQVWRGLFNTPYFQVTLINDIVPVELCGALKNGVALAFGFCQGLGLGNNTKAAIIRIGMTEMIRFVKLYQPVDSYNIFFESFAIADLCTTCFNGRNSVVAAEYVKSDKSIDVLEAEMLNGQKLQGPGTVECVGNIIIKKNLQGEFPLFMALYEILFGDKRPRHLIRMLEEYHR